MSSHLR